VVTDKRASPVFVPILLVVPLALFPVAGYVLTLAREHVMAMGIVMIHSSIFVLFAFLLSISLGNLTNAGYFLTGTVQKLPSEEFSVNLLISESQRGESRASFMENGTAEALQAGTLINGAVESLFAQMGVKLTETGHRTLVTGRYMAARAEAGYARGLVAQESGAAVEALLNYSQAVAFDPSQMESLARLGSLSSEIEGGSVSANIFNDILTRNAWIAAFKETAVFFNGHPPFEITYDPNLLQIGVTDYTKSRVDPGGPLGSGVCRAEHAGGRAGKDG
jgi:hypothetical protein